MLDEFGRGLRYPVLLEVAPGASAYQGGARDAPDDRLRFVDRTYPDGQINPIVNHIPHHIGQNQICLKAGMEWQEIGYQRKNVKAAERRGYRYWACCWSVRCRLHPAPQRAALPGHSICGPDPSVAEGAHVIVFGRRQLQLDAAVALIGPNVTAIQADAANLGDLDRVAAAIKANTGVVDIVVSNAGFTEQAR
jgi:short chain dehydrogenase